MVEVVERRSSLKMRGKALSCSMGSLAVVAVEEPRLMRKTFRRVLCLMLSQAGEAECKSMSMWSRWRKKSSLAAAAESKLRRKSSSPAQAVVMEACRSRSNSRTMLEKSPAPQAWSSSRSMRMFHKVPLSTRCCKL